MNLAVLSNTATKILGKRALTLKAHSPEILLITGIASVVGSTVLACRATIKAEQVMIIAKDHIERVNETMELVKSGEVSIEKYDEQDHKKDLTIVYTRTTVELVKLYAVPFTIGAAGIMCIIGGHRLLRARNLALMAAYKTLDDGFRAYRRRVAEAYGEEQEYLLRNGLRAEQVTQITTGENGKDVKSKVIKYVPADPNGYSVYARFFDDTCKQWSPNAEYNLYLLHAQQKYANDMLTARGHLFLNEVFDLLGMEHTQAGAVVGWKLGNGDDYVDFGLFDGDKPRARAFINGQEDAVLLDFNVDGIMYNLI